LEVKIDYTIKESIKYCKDKIVIKDKKYFLENKKSLREILYKDIISSFLEKKVLYWQEKMNLKALKVSYKKAKRQWGSCSYKNAISLNIYLIMLPPKVIDYIIVHELAHIVHKNHSKEFWSLVEKFLPNYKSLKKELKIYSSFLS